MTTSIQEVSLKFAEEGGSALHFAEQLADAYEQEKLAAEKLTPAAVDKLASLGFISENQKAEAREKLASHDGAVAIVSNLLDAVEQMKVAQQQQQALHQGQPVSDNTKAASESPARWRPVGARPGLGEKSAADRAFEERMLSRSHR